MSEGKVASNDPLRVAALGGRQQIVPQRAIDVDAIAVGAVVPGKRDVRPDVGGQVYDCLVGKLLTGVSRPFAVLTTYDEMCIAHLNDDGASREILERNANALNEDMSSEVSFSDGDLPLSEAQIAMLVARVKESLAADQLAEQIRRKAVEIRHSALPDAGGGACS